MTVNLFNAAPNSRSSELFRAWGYGLSSGLSAVGLTKTADTGQTDWVSFGFPNGGFQTKCYETWAFGDDLQATSPVFFKIGYGSGYSEQTPGVQLVVGTETNGAGVIQGNWAAFDMRGGNTNESDVKACIVSGSKNRVACILFQNSSQPFFFSIERTKDSSGQDTAEGIQVTVINSAGNGGSPSFRKNQFIPATSANLLVLPSEDLGFLTPTAVVSTSDGVNTSVYPNYLFKGGTILSPGLNTLAYLNNDFPQGSIVSIPRYGGQHSYYFIGKTAYAMSDGGNFAHIGRGYANDTCLAMLYE